MTRNQTVKPSPAAPPDLQAPELLEQLPRDELLTLALELGLHADPAASATELAAVIQSRRRLLAELDRDAMLEVVAWGRRPVKASASKEELARQIAKIDGMHFAGLSRRGLYTLAVLRGVREVRPEDDTRALRQRLRAHEGLFRKLNRKRRRLFGKLVARLIGDQQEQEYRFVPEERRLPSLKEQIEQRGVIGGLADRLRGAADDYIAAKLDEIESRIDRKLEEIDRRLGEWRDREIQNRLRILKITLVVSIIVATISLLYAYAVRHWL